MILKNQNILLFTRTMELGGTENVVLQLCEILKPHVNKLIVCSCGGVNEKKLKKMGIKHYTIPDITQKSPQFMLKIIIKLKHIVQAENITIIHSHHRMAAFYTELAFSNNIVKIATAHNTFQDKHMLTRFSYHNTCLIAVGEKVKENLLNIFGIPDKQITVIHNAIKPFCKEIKPIKVFQDAQKAGYTLIGNIGRLSEQKGMTYFIQAAAKVIVKHPKTKFFIVGSGELESKLKNEVKKLSMDGTIDFIGYRSDIQNVIIQLDFIVLSSLWEGLPLTPIEAFSVGKPVVATAVDGTTEIVDHKKNGLLVKPKNIGELESAIIEMIENKEQRKRMGINAFNKYKNNFSFEKMAECYLAYYSAI